MANREISSGLRKEVASLECRGRVLTSPQHYREAAGCDRGSKEEGEAGTGAGATRPRADDASLVDHVG